MRGAGPDRFTARDAAALLPAVVVLVVVGVLLGWGWGVLAGLATAVAVGLVAYRPLYRAHLEEQQRQQRGRR